MTCRTVRTPGGVAIVCDRRRPKRCSDCRSRPATLLCDWKIGGKTCDAKICATCAEEVAAGKHLCVIHQLAYEKWLDARQRMREGV